MTSDDRRAALLAARTVNGVDFVEVDPSSERTLIVHFVLNLPDAAIDPVPAGSAGDALGATNFTVTGGERTTSIQVVGAVRIADDQMQVTVDRIGDFSVYTLALQSGPNSPQTPTGFDPMSSSADFLFHIECAGQADCAATVVCPEVAPTPPRIDYLAKDYPGFVRVMLDRLALLAPRWQERNPADLGVALVETLAYVGDHMSYRQDVIATEAYLGTARLRTSVRRHARLVDYRIGEGRNSRAWLRVLLAPAATDGFVLPAKTRCVTTFPGAKSGSLAHDSASYQQAIDAAAVFFETMNDSAPLSVSLAEMPLYAWSESRSCLEAGGTRATLDGAFPQLLPGMVVVLAESKGPLTGDPADADVTHRQAVRLISVSQGVDPLQDRAITQIEWDPADAITFPLCVSSVTDAGHGETPIVGVSVAWGNIVLADQGRSIGDATDPTGAGPEPIGVVPPSGRFRPPLAELGLTFAAPPPVGFAPAAAASADAQARPVVSVRSVNVDGNVTTWTVADDLLEIGVGPQSPVFVPEIETDGQASLLFGDGTNGIRPEPGSLFTAAYRVGNGTAGNVARDAICVLDHSGVPGVVVGITNPLAAWGGVDPESVDAIRQRVPVAFRTQQRAVTAADYQTWAAQYPGVQRAAATLRWTGSWHTVTITIERDQQAALDAGFIAGLEAYLDGYRMAGVDLEVQDGIRVPLHVAMTVCVDPTYVGTDVERALLNVFSTTVRADGTPGLFNPDRLDLGQPVYASPLIAAAQAVDGVASVQLTAFERQDQPSTEGLMSGRLLPQRLEFFVLDDDPNYPERGRFDLSVRGGL